MRPDQPQPLVTFEVAAHRAEDARSNRIWRLDSDGSFRMHRNSHKAVRPEDADLFWYDAPMPDTPDRCLDETRMKAVRAFLDSIVGLASPTVRFCPGMEGGSRYRATFATPAGPRVIEVDSPERDFLDGVMLPLLDALRAGKEEA